MPKQKRRPARKKKSSAATKAATLQGRKGSTVKKKKVTDRKVPGGSTARKTKKKKTGAGTTKKRTGGSKRKKDRRNGKTGVGDAGLHVTVANDTGEFMEYLMGPKLQELAMRWRYVMSRRLRWKHGKHGSRKRMRKEAYKAITSLSSPDKVEAVLGNADLIEVQVPYRNERTAWEGRVAPWEFLLTEAAAEVGNTNPVSIVRWLQTGNRPISPFRESRVLYVECAPGDLSDEYDFTSERGMLERIFPNKVDLCLNPTISELRSAVYEHNPRIIHLAGIDNNEAKEMLQDKGKLPGSWPEQDGIVFAIEDPEDELGLVPISAEMLAGVLNSGERQLDLITANVYHSASRICALAVAEGATLALGFQDTVSDSLAEMLLQDFYTNWTNSREPLAAFVGALDTARSSSSLSGTGIVLWSSQSLLDGALNRIRSERESRTSSRKQPIVLDDNYTDWFSVNIKVRERLNYSLLHNDSGGLFEALEFRKEREGILSDVCVHVVLYLGSESHPYSGAFSLSEYLTKIDDQIKVPLTSSVIRTVSEPMRTSLYVEVTVGEKIVRRETFRVTLLPVDEWKDTDSDRIWLPSFVLPRDPAIESIIDRAQKHLITLADSLSCGFDGYQSTDPNDPESLVQVDLQVQAIWAAVVNDFGIRYINPPPSYTVLGQRLRTPTQIVRGGRGTCIDLALLLSACLEYVEIYPVIFLLDGHAFAGYWRSDERYVEFTEARQEGIENVTMLGSIGTTGNQAAWILPSDSYAEILNEVNHGFLYPLETVGFTTHGSFWEAIEEGVDNLRSRSEFHSLIDIWSARSEYITPLPIIDEPAVDSGGRER